MVRAQSAEELTDQRQWDVRPDSMPLASWWTAKLLPSRGGMSVATHRAKSVGEGCAQPAAVRRAEMPATNRSPLSRYSRRSS